MHLLLESKSFCSDKKVEKVTLNFKKKIPKTFVRITANSQSTRMLLLGSADRLAYLFAEQIKVSFEISRAFFKLSGILIFHKIFI